MIHKILIKFVIYTAIIASFSSCFFLKENSKNGFNDGIYQTKRFGGKKVYVMSIDADTISVFPVLEFKDSTAILTRKRINYTTIQKKFKDSLTVHNFYKPSFDLDLLTIAMKYRPAIEGIPNQLTTSFNGAVFGGYRIDAYKLKYKRTPLNNYKQHVTHLGYSGGLYGGVGNTSINGSTLGVPNSPLLYDGVVVIIGISANMAIDNMTFGLAFGTDYLMDSYHNEWIYEGKPTLGFTIGLNVK